MRVAEGLARGEGIEDEDEDEDEDDADEDEGEGEGEKELGEGQGGGECEAIEEDAGGGDFQPRIVESQRPMGGPMLSASATQQPQPNSGLVPILGPILGAAGDIINIGGHGGGHGHGKHKKHKKYKHKKFKLKKFF